MSFCKVAALDSSVNMKEELSSYCAVVNNQAKRAKHHSQFDQTVDRQEAFVRRRLGVHSWGSRRLGGGGSCIRF